MISVDHTYVAGRLPHPRRIKMEDCQPIAEHLLDLAIRYNERYGLFAFPDGRLRFVVASGETFDHLTTFHRFSFVGVYDRHAKSSDVARDLMDLHAGRV